MKQLNFASIIVFLLTVVGIAQTITLKNGTQIKGEIISEKKDYVIVDLGFSALTVSMNDILAIDDSIDDSADQIGSDSNALAQIDAVPQRNNKLYYIGDGQLASIEKCVEQCSEAVVLVSHPAGLGSGFFINEEGYLITNYHVIEGETKITVTLFRKTDSGFDKIKFKKVKIVAINPFVDLALLKVEDLGDTKITYAPFAGVDDLKVGQKVFAIGNPLGLERSVHDGIISTRNRAFEGLVYLQTNTDINPGNSGGPLFNLKGQIVGVTNMGYIFMGGLGFAIPISYVKDFVDNYDAFAYDVDSPNTGYTYIQPDGKIIKE
jgi:serine protease Do